MSHYGDYQTTILGRVDDLIRSEHIADLPQRDHPYLDLNEDPVEESEPEEVDDAMDHPVEINFSTYGASTSRGSGPYGMTGFPSDAPMHNPICEALTELGEETLGEQCSGFFLEKRNYDYDTDDLYPGMLFNNKNEVEAAVRIHNIRAHRTINFVESNQSIFSVCCIHIRDGCNWRLRAVNRQTLGKWEITKFVGPHVCIEQSISQDHALISAKLIASIITPVIKADPSLSVRAIQATIRERFKYHVSYYKAWNARQKAIASIFGNWDESYRQLPKLMGALQKFNPGTVVEWLVLPRNNDIHQEATFHRMFWAFRTSIEGFAHCRPVISVMELTCTANTEEKF